MIGALILGVLAGFIGRALMPGRQKMGLLMTIALGLIGAAVGWLIFTLGLGIGDDDMFDLGGLLGAVIGVMIVLGIYGAVAGNRDKGRGAAARLVAAISRARRLPECGGCRASRSSPSPSASSWPTRRSSRSASRTSSTSSRRPRRPSRGS